MGGGEGGMGADLGIGTRGGGAREGGWGGIGVEEYVEEWVGGMG